MLSVRPFSSHLPAALFCAALALSFSSSHALAEDKITGIPIVQESGLLIINGQKIALWGIDPLAPDQQCWQDKTPWCCGENATTALRHFVEGRMVECKIKQKPNDGPMVAQCFRQKGQAQVDLGHFLVSHGWALDKGEASGGAYFAAENEAQARKRGVWESRFQTAKDWREGNQKFVGEDEETENKNNED